MRSATSPAATISVPATADATVYVPSERAKRAFNSLSDKVFGVPKLRQRQEEGLCFLFENRECSGIILQVDCTGGGKSHTMRCAGKFAGGITLVVEPLLVLAGDVYTKFVVKDNRYGTVNTLHFDECISLMKRGERS